MKRFLAIFLSIFLSIFLLTGCFYESEAEKKNRQYWEEQPMLLPQQIEELKNSVLRTQVFIRPTSIPLTLFLRV